MTLLTSPVQEGGAAQGLLSQRSNVLAFAEGMILLSGVAWLEAFGYLAMSNLPVHPYLFVTMLLGAQYGVQGGVFTSIGAILITGLVNWPSRPLDVSYDVYFMMVWAHPLSWVAAGLTVGIITSSRSRALRIQSEQLQKAELARKMIASQYEVLAHRTKRLEQTLAGFVVATADPIGQKAVLASHDPLVVEITDLRASKEKRA
jgi:hypothetical protein